MLTVAKVTHGQAAGYAEYLDGRSRPSELGDYYLRNGDRVEAPGKWTAGAATVGCNPDRPVAGHQLRALLAVRRPDTGEALRRVGGNGEAVAAIDATFSAPKSVSAVWALADRALRELIEQAHEVAIDRALVYATQIVPMIRERTGPDHVIHLRPESLVATSWRHTTARAVDGQPPDPQLHSHVLLHAAVRRDGKLVAIDSRSCLVHRRELGGAYRTELAHQLAGLGFTIQRATGRGGRYFEIQGVPEMLIEAWSSRHHEIRRAIQTRIEDKRARLGAILAEGGARASSAQTELEQLDLTGQLSPREDRYLTSATRAPKHGIATRGDLDRHWALAATNLGFRPSHVSQLMRSTQPANPASGEELLRRLTEFDATFTDREARAAGLEASTGIPIYEALAVLGQIEASGELLALADGGHTTAAHRQLEQQTIAAARSLAGGRTNAIPDEVVERELVALEADIRRNGGELTVEQRAAIKVACSNRRIVMIEGQAGSGKSTVLSAIAHAHEAAGQRIVVTSTAALAAQRLASELREAGVDVCSYSTVAIARAVDDGRVVLSPRVTVIHDEAALASTREQHHLLSAVEARDARLIEIGDPRQSQAVGAAGLWTHLEHTMREHEAHIRLQRNVRALDPADRRDQQLFRDGEHERSLHGYHTRQRIHLREEQRAAEDVALEAAHADRQAGRRTLVLAQTSNERLDELNARAQAIRNEHLELGNQGLPLPRRPYELHAGDDVQVRRTIAYTGAGHLRNGATAKVLDVDADRELLTLRLASGEKIVLDRDQIDQADLRLAYVQHPFPAQGQTTDTAHLIVAEHATAEGSYVALTRARASTHLYASQRQLEPANDREPLQSIAERLGRSEPQVPSIDTPLAHETAIDRHVALDSSTVEPAAQARPWIATLGPEPDSDSPERPAWKRTTHAIENYRTRYDIDPEDPALLGPEPPAGSFQQRHERRQTAAAVLEALDELELDRRERPSIEQLTHAGRMLTIKEPEPEASIGWEP